MTLSDEEFFVDDKNLYDGKTWKQLKAASIIVPGKYFGELKHSLIEHCRKANNCPRLTEFHANSALMIIQRNERRQLQDLKPVE